MRYFLCLVHPSGEPVGERLRSRYAVALNRQHTVPVNWVTADGFAATAGTLDGLGPSIARRSLLIGVGDVRLDNRNDVARWGATPAAEATDLEVVLSAIEWRGSGCIGDLLGDFAFVVWDIASRELIAAHDAFGIRMLHYSESEDLLALSSRASLIARDDDYNLQFIADSLLGGSNFIESSPFAGVSTLPSGCTLTYRNGSIRVTEYWSPHRFTIQPSDNVATQVECFRELFSTAVQLRLTGAGDVWAQLSGGLDSSSVVSMAQSFAEKGIAPAGVAGTITMVDSLGDGDEREFVDAVTRRYRVRNKQIVDYWMWQDDGQDPPLTETPGGLYPLYARDRRCCDIIRAAGGRVLLTGVGADHYLSALPYYIADWITRGEVSAAARELLRWSVLTRTSFWQELFRSGVRPLLPAVLRHATRPQYSRVPSWVEPSFAKAFALEQRYPEYRSFDCPAGNKYASVIADQIGHFGRHSDRTPFDESLEVRHPFLYRPLVEFSLRLAPELRTRPLEQKWILRQAMRGVLPEAVRRRRSKGGLDGRLAWSLSRERGRIDEMMRDLLLGQLGCVDPQRLRSAIDSVRTGRESSVVSVIDTLSLETWLRVRSGRWTVRESRSPRVLQFAESTHAV